MLSKRIIACLDVRNGRTVKGVNFENLRDSGDPLELAVRYMEEGADELVLLDITATEEKRKTLSGLVTRIAREISIPFTVGGGISSTEDVSDLLNAGADKISVNTAAFKDPGLLYRLARRYGSQCIVLAIDTRKNNNGWFVSVKGGKEHTEEKAFSWARKGVDCGAGEILLTSMSNDGTQQGFATDITRQISEGLNVPVIASGGAGIKEHFEEIFVSGKADAALAAGIFHDGSLRIGSLKTFLAEKNIRVRI